MTYRECCEWGKLVLIQAEIPEAKLEARLLLQHVFCMDMNDLMMHAEENAGKEGVDAYQRLIHRRAEHIPLQYLTGVQNFMGLDFQVNGNVLVPRQDTEILVEEVMRELHDGMRILDMCTGSGCILVSLLHYSNDCQGVGVDLSENALSVARENAAGLLGEKAENIQFLQSDLFENVSGRFEFIVSNPPYIASHVIPTLMSEVRDHEPLMALDGGEDGLYFYRRIVKESRDYLINGGMLYFEIGCDQAAAVTELMELAGFREVSVVKDLAGLDRVVYGTYIR